MNRFYLGTHEVHWLRFLGLPACVSYARLVRHKRLPRATVGWMQDSGGFTQITQYGEWTVTPQAFIYNTRRHQHSIGMLEHAAPQDWMCEPAAIARSGLTVDEHQRRTVDNYVLLCREAPDIPWFPVLQGWVLEDYIRCSEMYRAVWVCLEREPLVGLVSVCRRHKTTEI